MRGFKFKLGGAEWRLSWKRSLAQGEDSRCWGETHGVDRKIVLSRKELEGKPDVAARIMFHELLHAALHMGGLDAALHENSEEAVVSCLENILWELISSGEFTEILDKVRSAAGRSNEKS